MRVFFFFFFFFAFFFSYARFLIGLFDLALVYYYTTSSSSLALPLYDMILAASLACLPRFAFVAAVYVVVSPCFCGTECGLDLCVWSFRGGAVKFLLLDIFFMGFSLSVLACGSVEVDVACKKLKIMACVLYLCVSFMFSFVGCWWCLCCVFSFFFLFFLSSR